jgi:hypothetical protein
MKSLRSTIVLLLLNATWLAVLSYYAAKRFGNQLVRPGFNTSPITSRLLRRIRP